MNKLKNKLNSLNLNFAKNIITSIVVPAVIVVFALVIGLIFGFNKGMDFNGGIIVSVVTDEYNLEIAEDYNTFKGKVDKILQDNGVSGSAYLTEKHTEYQDDVLVVKINYSGEDATQIAESIKSELVTKFYAGEETLVTQNNLVECSTFGSSADSWKILASFLATLVAVLAICVYVGFRTLSVHTPVMAFLASVISGLLATAVVILTRIQVNLFSLAVIPMISIVSMVSTFIYAGRVNSLLKTGNYDRKPNNVLTSDAVKNSLYTTICLTSLAVLISLIFAFANVTSIVSHLGLTLLVSSIAIAYNYVFIMPAIYSLTYVRKVKKEKAKKEQKQEKLDEVEVLKETDLDNLVSN